MRLLLGFLILAPLGIGQRCHLRSIRGEHQRLQRCAVRSLHHQQRLMLCRCNDVLLGVRVQAHELQLALIAQDFSARELGLDGQVVRQRSVVDDGGRDGRGRGQRAWLDEASVGPLDGDAWCKCGCAVCVCALCALVRGS